MKVSVNASDLIRMLKLAGRIVVGNNGSILSGKVALSVHDGKFEVIAIVLPGNTTQLTQWVDAGPVLNDDFESVPAEDGLCVVRAKDFAPLKSAAKKSTVILSRDNGPLSVTADGFAFDVNAESGDEFPDPLMPGDDLAETLEIVPDDCERFGYICLALSDDISRPDFTGAVLRNGALVSTDSYRLHYCPLPALFGTGTLLGIISPEMLKFIADGHSGTFREYTETVKRKEKRKGQDIEISEAFAKWHALEAPGMTIISQPVKGQFPDFSKCVPRFHADEIREIETETLRRTLKTMCAGWKDSLTVRFNDDPEGLKLTCTGKPGPKSLDQPPRTAVLNGVKLSGLPAKYNPAYVMDALSGAPDKVNFCIIDADSPAWVGEWNGGPGRGALVMPMYNV